MEFIIWGLLPTGFYEYITTSYNYDEVEEIIQRDRARDLYVNYYISGESEYLRDYVNGGIIDEYIR